MKKNIYSYLKNYTHAIEAPRRKRRGIFDPFLFIIFVLANPAASFGEYARRIQQIVGIGLLGIISILSVNAQPNPWTQKSDMPTGRHFSAIGVVGGKIYIIGGRNDNFIWGQNNNLQPESENLVTEYDPVTDTWDTTKTPIPIAAQSYGSAVVDGIIYVIGGIAEHYVPAIANVQAYDPATDTWDTTRTPMPTPRDGLGTCVVDGKIYAIGGMTSGYDFWTGMRDTVEIYDPVTDSWSTGSSMPTMRVFFSTSVVEGKIYAIGGALIDHEVSSTGELLTSQQVTSTVEVYDPVTDTWTTKSSMPTARAAHEAAVLDGIIYVIGGGTHSYDPGGFSVVEAYNPETDTWTTMADIPAPRALACSDTIENKVYVFGGITKFSDPDLHGEKTVFVYDPLKDLSELIASCTINKHSVVAGNDSVCIQVKISDPEGVTLFAEIESPDKIPLDSLQLFDDGNHNDGDTGDSIYANVWPVSFDEELQYYVDLEVTRIKQDTVIHQFDNVASFTSIVPSEVAYWKFDETEGTILSDEGEHSLDGTLMNMAPSSWTGGISGGGLNFKGTNGYVEIPHSGALDFADQGFSISLWFKAGTLNGSSMYLVHKGAFAPSDVVGENGCWFGFEIKQDQLRFAIDDNIVKSVTLKDGFSALLENEWNHIAGVRDRSEEKLKLYVNGKMISSTEDQTGSISEEVNMLLGNSFRRDAPLSGVLDEVKIFNYALSGEEVQEIYDDLAEFANAAVKKVTNEFVLLENYPNPFSQSTTIQFNLQESGFVTLRVYDFLGNEVKILISVFLDTGEHSIDFNAAGLPGGIYFCRLETGSIAITQKMVLVR